MDVALLRWPAELERREHLAHRGVPRLLLLAADVPAPAAGDCMEDWIRLPAHDGDIEARVAVLSARTRTHGAGPRPVLDDDDVLRFRGSWVSLPPIEAQLTRALTARLGVVVRRSELNRCAWPDGAPRRNVLDVHMVRLRRRVEPLGLIIRTVRARGYLMELTPASPSPAGSPGADAGQHSAASRSGHGMGTE